MIRLICSCDESAYRAEPDQLVLSEQPVPYYSNDLEVFNQLWKVAE